MNNNILSKFCLRLFGFAERSRVKGFNNAAKYLYEYVLRKSNATGFVDMLRAASRHLLQNTDAELLACQKCYWERLKDKYPERLGPMYHWANLSACSGERDDAQQQFKSAVSICREYSEEAFYWKIAYIDFLVKSSFILLVKDEIIKLREEIHLYPLAGIVPTDVLLAEAETASAKLNPHKQIALLGYATLVHPFDGRGWAALSRALVGFDPNWSKDAALMAITVDDKNESIATDLSRILLRHIALNFDGVTDTYRSYIESIVQRKRDPKLLVTLAEISFLSGNYSLAYDLSQEALQDIGDDFHCLFVATKAAFSMKKITEAEDYLLRAIEADPRNAVWHMHQWSTSFRIIYRSSLYKTMENYFDSKFNEDSDICLLPNYNDEWHYQELRKRREKLQRQGLPSCVLVTQGKSGSVSVGSILMSGFGLVDAAYSLGTRKIIPSWLKYFGQGGCCHVTHLVATAENVARLKENGVKVIVHLRDPRQVIMSHVFHNLKYEKANPLLKIDGFDDMNLSDQIDYVMYTMWEELVYWIDKWVAASSKLDITFTTFENFKKDRYAFADHLVAAYGGDKKMFNRDNIFVKDINVDNHFRSGHVNEWRSAFNKDQLAFVNDNFRREWANLFGWEV